MIPATEGNAGGRRQLLLVAALLAFAALFVGLGVWQVKRLAWKEALIARVNAGLSALPVRVESLPRGITMAQAKGMEYRRLSLHGNWIVGDTELVAGPSSLGTGYWAVTPLRMGDGEIVYVNRGFVPMGTKRGAVIALTPTAPVDVVGLMRVSEPGGSFMRPNRPEADLWTSRDIVALAQRHHLSAQTGWFIDAQAVSGMNKELLAKQPVAGLTVVSFPNNHLGYAITWFTLALLCLGAIFVVRRYRA
ncbi:MAG: SURF1 family protein [Sphingomonadales bacterium]|nr:SURF1 family protein [Sphingomonadales bacterium]MDE2168495.1 SURF1 family protein [Sphingomonadales bacterium]